MSEKYQIDNKGMNEDASWMGAAPGSEEDDFDRTVSAFSGARPAPKSQTEQMAEEPEDDFDRTVSTFSGARPKPTRPTGQMATQPPREERSFREPEAKPGRMEEEDDFERTVSAFSGARLMPKRPTGQRAPQPAPGAGKKLFLPLKILLMLYAVIETGIMLLLNVVLGCLAIAFWVTVWVIRCKGTGSYGGVKKGILIAVGVALTLLSVVTFIPLLIGMSLISLLLAFLLTRNLS